MGPDVYEVQMALDQFHPLKRMVLRDRIDYELLKTDPFLLLASVITTSLLSWSQLLNVMKEIVKDSHNSLDLNQHELRYELQQLKYHAGMLHRTKEQISDILELVEEGGCASWPKATSEAQLGRKEEVQKHLRSDCLNLINRFSLMIAQCDSATAVLVGFVQVTAAERAMSQAKELQDLTKLATLFIPLGFATNIFSMNIKEWEPPPTIWYFIGVVIVILSLTFVHLYRFWLFQGTNVLE